MSECSLSKIRVSPPPGIEILIPEYLCDRRQELSLFEAALEQGDFERIRILGHDLKGTGGGYGFMALTEIGARMEQAALRREPNRVREELDGLTDYLGRVEVVTE